MKIGTALVSISMPATRSDVRRASEVARQQLGIQSYKLRAVAIRSTVVSTGHRVGQLMQQPPGWTGVRQPDRQPIRVRHRRAGLARERLDLRWKEQPHFSPNGIHHALRLCERDRTLVAWCNETLLPRIDLAALAISNAGHGSKGLPAVPTGRLRLTRSPAASPCRNAPFRRARFRPAVATSRISVSRKASSTT